MAAATDADDNRRAINNRGEDKAAVCWVIDGIDQDSRSLTRLKYDVVKRLVIGCRNHQTHALDICNIKRTCNNRESSLRKCCKSSIHLFADNRDPRASL